MRRSLRDNIGCAPPLLMEIPANEERPEMPPEELAERLFHLGWIRSPDISEVPEWERLVALTGYQAFHGLTPDGWAGRQTERSMEMPRICALPDVLSMGATLSKWSFLDVKVGIAGTLQQFSREVFIGAIQEACSYWNSVCGIRLQVVNGTQCNILINTGAIDRAGGTLAWSELPSGNRPTLNQLYDTAEMWVVAEHPRMSEIDLVRVCAHELAHAIGIPHIGSGNLLAPIYSQSIRRPQQGDIAEAVARYGQPMNPQPPVPAPPTPIPPNPNPPSPDPGRQTAAITFQGSVVSASIPGFRVTPSA